MRVLVFTSLFSNNVWPNNGVFVKERMCEVARLGRCELRVVAPVPYYPPVRFGSRAGYARVVREQVIDSIQVYHPRYFMIPKVGMALQGWTMFLSMLPFVAKLRRKFEFDLLDAHYVYPDGFAAVLLGAVLNKPVVVSARGSDINEFAKFPTIRRMLRYTLNSAAHSIAVCQALKDAITRLGIPSAKVSVIPNGVDIKKFFRSPSHEAREILGLPSRHRIVLSVGALIPRKGHDYTIRAVKLLIEKRQYSDSLLVLAGSGPERNDLELLVRSLGLEEHVWFVGEIPHQQLRLWYSAADLCCLSSEREGWPNVILESLACGTPVVATGIWGVPEIIESDSFGLLTKRDDQEIATTLHRALSMAWSRETIIEFARQKTWNRAAEAVQSVFESVLKVPPPAQIADGTADERRSMKQPVA
jgi:glycosyltransferase involved in cell wall biosynthesis